MLRTSLLALALLAQAPYDFTPARQRGLELLIDGKPAEALAVFKAAVKAGPGSAEAHLELANTHVAVADAIPADGGRQASLRHLEQAQTHYRRAQALSPELADLVSLRLLTVYDRGLPQVTQPSS